MKKRAPELVMKDVLALLQTDYVKDWRAGLEMLLREGPGLINPQFSFAKRTTDVEVISLRNLILAQLAAIAVIKRNGGEPAFAFDGKTISVVDEATFQWPDDHP